MGLSHELLDDDRKVRVHYRLRTAWGQAEERGSFDIAYDEIPRLRPCPTDFDPAEAYEIFVPSCQITMVLRVYQMYEAPWSLTDHIAGPCLKSEPVSRTPARRT